MKDIVVGNSRIGSSSDTYIIAEACENHLGEMSIAKEMISAAKKAGANAIKFQHHLASEEMLPSVDINMESGESLFNYLERTCFSIDQQAELKTACEEAKIDYLCTPFSYRAAEELNDIGISAFKIGSGEMADIPTLLKIAAFGKPLLVSTGMSLFEEIDETYKALRKEGAPFCLFNCVSEYPPKYEDLNLGVITQMASRYPDIHIGHSDHSVDNYSCFAAVALGAQLIEKHIVLDKKMNVPDLAVSIDMKELADLVEGIRKIEVSLGGEKRISVGEKPVRDWAYRSIVAVRDIAKGVTVTQEMVWSKRPGSGIPAKEMQKVIGHVATQNISANTLISWGDLRAA